MQNLEGIVPEGEYTTDDVLNIMQGYAVKDHASEEIQNLAMDITSGINPSDPNSMMLAVRNWILANMTFILDHDEARRMFNIDHPDLEMVKAPVQTLESRRYDCDCVATLIASMLMALGIPTRFVVVSYQPIEVTGPDGYSHVFAQGHDGRDWVTIDPVSYPNEMQMMKDSKQFKIHEVS